MPLGPDQVDAPDAAGDGRDPGTQAVTVLGAQLRDRLAHQGFGRRERELPGVAATQGRAPPAGLGVHDEDQFVRAKPDRDRLGDIGITQVEGLAGGGVADRREQHDLVLRNGLADRGDIDASHLTGQVVIDAIAHPDRAGCHPGATDDAWLRFLAHRHRSAG